MDNDDNDFQNQNLHLTGEANNKLPLELQPYAIPKYDFDDTINTYLRFDSLVETESFLGIEGNEDNNWIEDFSRESSSLVFSSGAKESSAISRHNNVWSEATSLESVELLLNSVGQDEVIVRENTIKKSDITDELGFTVEQMESGHIYDEKSLFKEETSTLLPNPTVDDTPGDSFVLKTDDRQGQVLVKDDLPTVANELSKEENTAILASNNATVEGVDTAGHDKLGTEMTDTLLDQMEDEVNEESRMENDLSDGTVQTVVTCSGDLINPKTLLPETFNDENDIHNVASRDAQLVVVDAHSVSHINSASEIENAILASNTATIETVDAAVHDKLGTEMTDSSLDQTEDEVTEESRMENALSDGTVPVVVTYSGELNNQTTLLPETLNDENDINEHIQCSDIRNDPSRDAQSVFVEAHSDSHINSHAEVETILPSNAATVEAVDTSGHDKFGTDMTDSFLDQMEDEANEESRMENALSDGTVPTVVTCGGELNNQTTSLPETLNDENDISIHIKSSDVCTDTTIDAQSDLVEAHSDSHINSASEVKDAILPSNTTTVEGLDTEMTDSILEQTEDKANQKSRMENDFSDVTVTTVVTCSDELNNQKTSLPETLNDENDINDHIHSSDNGNDLTVDSQSVFVEAHSDNHIKSASEVQNAVLASNTATAEAVDTEMTDSFCEQMEDKCNEKSRVENDFSDRTAQTLVSCSDELNKQKTSLLETFNDENDISDQIQSTDAHNDLTMDAQSVLIDVHSDSHIILASKAENVEAENFGETGKSDSKEMELSDVPEVERGNQAYTTLEVVGQDVSGDHLVSSAHTNSTVEAPLEIVVELTTLTSNVSIERSEWLSHQPTGVIASEHESTSQSETHTKIKLVETSESVYVSPMDSMIATTKGCVSTKSDNSEGAAGNSNLSHSVELAVNTNDRDQDGKSSQILSESIVSESVVYVSVGSSSKLAESKSQPNATLADKSGNMIAGKESEASPLNPEELQHLSQYGAPAVGLTSSIDLQKVKTSSDANEQGNFFETEKVSSGKSEDGQTVPTVDASSSRSQIDEQARKHTEDNQQSAQFVEGGPASEESKDGVDTDASEQVLPQQPEGTSLEENLVTEVAKVPETRSILGKTEINEKPNTSSFANLRSEAEKDGQVENNVASDGIMTAATLVSHPKGDAIGIVVSPASCSEPSVKSHVTENAATNLETLVSCPTVKTSELQLNKTETNSVKMSEDHNISTFMSAESLVLNSKEAFSSGMNITSDLQKAEAIPKAVILPEATIVSPIVGELRSTPSQEKSTARSSKIKSERKPRQTSKSTGKDTSRKGKSVKGATPFQNGDKTNFVNQSSASSIQITQSTEKHQSLQTPALKAFGTLSTPMTNLPDLNSSSLPNILCRPFTDFQQVQLRAQIFVYGALIQGTAPDEAYMISAFGGLDGGKGSWEKAWRACVVRAQKLHAATPETPLQSRAGKRETLSAGQTSSKERSSTNSMIPHASPLWSLSTSLDTLQSSSVQRGSAAGHQPLLSSLHTHQTSPITPWMSPVPYRNPWLASPQTSGFNVGSRVPVFPITEPVKLTPVKESSLPYSGTKHVQSGISSNIFKGTPTLEPTMTVVAPAQHSTGTKSRKRKKMPVSVEPSPSILNSLKQTEVAVSPLVSISTSVPITNPPANLASNAGTMANVVSITAVPMKLVDTFARKKIKSSFPSPIFGGNLLPEVMQTSVLSEDTIDKLKEAKMHAENASALATAAVSHSEYVWKQIEQQRHADLQSETQGRLASAAVAIAAAAAVAKAAAAAANVAANAALQAKLMAEEASLLSFSSLGNESHKSNDYIIPGQDIPASILKGESAAKSSNSVLIAAREASKKRVEAATAATKRAENMDSIVKAAELASEAVSQAGILVSIGHHPLNKLVEAGPSNYWKQAQESQEVQHCKTGVLEKETVATSDGTFANPRIMQTELDGSVKTAYHVSGPVSATRKNTKGKKGGDSAKNNDVVFEPEVGSKSSIDTQTESEQITKTTNNESIKEGSNVEVFKEEPGLRTAWYSATVLSLEDDRAYVLFNDLSVEQGTDKLKEWVALRGEGDEAPKIRTACSVTAMPYEGTRKRRRAAICDPVWKIGDRVDSWVHDSWLEGVITEKNKKDLNTVTVHIPAQGDNLTIKAWNLRPSRLWKDGKWTECSSKGEDIRSSHEGDTPKEKRPRLGTPSLVAEGEDTSMKIVDVPDLGKLPETGVLDLGVSENTFNIGRSSREENKPNPLRTKRIGLQKQGSKVIFGVPKPGKKRKFMDVSKHYVSEASTKTGEQKEPTKPVKSVVPKTSGPGSWRMPSKTISREKQPTISKPVISKPAPKTKEKPGSAARIIPRKDSRNKTAANMDSDDDDDQKAENKGSASETVKEQTASSSRDNGSKRNPTAGRLAKIEENKALAENASKTSEEMEPRRSIRRIQPTSRLLEGIQTSMMTSKVPWVPHSKSKKKVKASGGSKCT